MLIIKYRKIFFWITGVILAMSVGSMLYFGLNFGIDFTGGALVEARYEVGVPDKAQIEEALTASGFSGSSVREGEEGTYFIRTASISDEQRLALEDILSINDASPVSLERFTEIGPTIGQELRSKAGVALLLVMVAIVLYVAFVFRHVSRPLSSWVYGTTVIVALLHDIIVPVGVFAILGYVFGAQIDTLFVMAILAILGYSVNDTIVVFDRVRENLRRNIERGRKEEFALTVGKSLDQTFVRSVNTSMTTLLVLTALFFLGPDATQDFALTLIVGVIAGTYSSLCLASPLLVTVERWRK